MLKDFIGKKVEIAMSFGDVSSGSFGAIGQLTDSFMGDRSALAFIIRGTFKAYDDKFIQLDDGTVVSLMYIRFIKLSN